nr:hypothetical protein [Aeromonas caviae]
MENRLLKQEIEHRLRLQGQLHQDQERLLTLLGEGADPMVFIDEQGTVLFASRVLARFAGTGARGHGRAAAGRVAGGAAGQPVADMAENPEQDLASWWRVSGIGSTPAPCPSTWGAARLCLTLGTEPRQDDNRMAALENALQEPLSPGHHRGWPVAGELSRLGGEFRSLADDLIRQQDDEPLRRAWWTPCVSPWRPGSRAPARAR